MRIKESCSNWAPGLSKRLKGIGSETSRVSWVHGLTWLREACLTSVSYLTGVYFFNTRTSDHVKPRTRSRS